MRALPAALASALAAGRRCAACGASLQAVGLPSCTRQLGAEIVGPISRRDVHATISVQDAAGSQGRGEQDSTPQGAQQGSTVNSPATFVARFDPDRPLRDESRRGGPFVPPAIEKLTRVIMRHGQKEIAHRIVFDTSHALYNMTRAANPRPELRQRNPKFVKR
jgi:hypothetical protein